MDPSQSFLNTGDVVGLYRVERLLGEGGMAAVYQVRHIELGTVCALKVLTMSGKQVRTRMLEEGRIQSQLLHPNAVQVYHVFEMHGVTMLLLEYVDGCDLEDWLEERGGCDLEAAESIFLSILDAVEEAHRLGLVHRDLKPANVLMARERGVWVPKVADFGIAKVVGSSNDLSMTRTGVAMGTPSFMAPEQINDAKNVDKRADIFSLGCILYTLVCGQQPFSGNVLHVFASIQGGTYTPPEELVPGLPDRFIRTIRGCLEVEQEDRLQNCAAVRRSLYEPPAVEVPKAYEEVPLPPTRRARVATAITSVLVSGVALTGLALVGFVVAINSGEEEEGPDVCAGPSTETIGYAFAEKGLYTDIEQSREVSFQANDVVFVYEDYPRAQNAFRDDLPVVCIIEDGTIVDLDGKPKAEAETGWWVPIVPAALHPPEPEPLGDLDAEEPAPAE